MGQNVDVSMGDKQHYYFMGPKLLLILLQVLYRPRHIQEFVRECCMVEVQAKQAAVQWSLVHTAEVIVIDTIKPVGR